MRNIIVISQPEDNQLSVIDICNEWREKFSVISVSNESEAGQLLQQNEIDLVICDLDSKSDNSTVPLQELLFQYPFVPCIAIIDPEIHTCDDILKMGVSSCLETPFKNEDLYRWANELVEVASSGTINGLPIHSLLQMIEGEARTCTLKVTRNDTPESSPGFIFVEKGVVTTAEHEILTGEHAVYEILGWESSTAEIKFYNSIKEYDIDKSLMALVMEAFRLKDERENSQQDSVQQDKASMDLKHFSTAGKGLLLENGLRIKMEYASGKKPVQAIVVGSVPGKYLIVTKPSGLEQAFELFSGEQRIVTKYLHMGRLCMFKTSVLQELSNPDNLLFLEYPMVIHYRELRRAKRATTFIPCRIQLPSGPSYLGVIIDISFMGCLCQMRAVRNNNLPRLDIGNELSIQGLFPGVKEEQEFSGVVKNTKRTNSELRIGVEITDLPESIKEIISNYQETLISHFN